jgi:hypothetical protein
MNSCPGDLQSVPKAAADAVAPGRHPIIGHDLVEGSPQPGDSIHRILARESLTQPGRESGMNFAEEKRRLLREG